MNVRDLPSALAQEPQLHTFDVYQQLPPQKTGEVTEEGDEIHEPVIVKVGSVLARTAEEAMAEARTWSRFSQRSKSTLMAFPIVEDVEMTARGEVAEERRIPDAIH